MRSFDFIKTMVTEMAEVEKLDVTANANQIAVATMCQ